MEAIIYQSPVPAHRRFSGSFIDRNPNMSYLVYSDEGHAVLIDACSAVDVVSRDMGEKHLHLDYLLLTHDHCDHTFALEEWLKKFPNLSVGIHKSSSEALASRGIKQLLPLSEGMVINVGDGNLSVMETPGHTRDSLCFWDEKGSNLFTGDAILGGGIGCCDYIHGGNRNIFYQTIARLLKVLPSQTHICPGHFSEQYRMPPPYELEAEKRGNPYLVDALQGKRRNFNRALKIFSQEFETAKVIMLDDSALNAICKLEKEIWIPELQASREVIGDRLRHGHKLLSIEEDAGMGLAGMLGWCYSSFSIEGNAEDFPRNFRQFSNCKSCLTASARSAFIYNLGVKPAARRKGVGSLLLQEAFEKIRKDGVAEVFIDSRMPSYNGSQDAPQENIAQNSALRDAVGSYFSTGRLPDDDIFRSDPAVSFYMKNGLAPWLILPDFIHDPPSGNMRVICYINLYE